METLRGGEEDNRPHCCLSCRDNIPPKSNSVHKSCRTFFFPFLPQPTPLPFFQSDSCLGNRGKSSFSQTDVPFSWKLEYVKNPWDANYFKVLRWREGNEGRGRGEERNRKKRGKKGPEYPTITRHLPPPPLLVAHLLSCGLPRFSTWIVEISQLIQS